MLTTGLANSARPEVYRYYLALLFADDGEFAAAERLLAQCRPEQLGFLEGKYHYLYGEMLRIRGDRKRAKREYRLSLEKLDAKALLRPVVQEALNALADAPDESETHGTTSATPAGPSRE